MNIEAAKSKYKFRLKSHIYLDPTSKEYTRSYYILLGMESVLETLGVNIGEINEEVYDKYEKVKTK